MDQNIKIGNKVIKLLMGQKQSTSSLNSRYLTPLPNYYEKSHLPEIYSLKTTNKTPQQLTNPIDANPQTLPSKQTHQQQTLTEPKISVPFQNQIPSDYPQYLRHYVIILNKFQTQVYLNHLVYRNQPQFKDFIIQLPYGEIQKQEKYTKVHLYGEQMPLTLNQVSHLPFTDMCMVLYTTLIAYKYLYSYFGFFKIEQNMIGFTREAKVKVWLNHKVTKDKPQPIISDINLKRLKQEQSYMVADLLTIFWNKVDRQMIPNNFNLLKNITQIRNTRLNASRMIYSRFSTTEKDFSKSMINSLQSNLVEDFSDSSFDRCLKYLEDFLYMQRPQFLRSDIMFSTRTEVESNEPTIIAQKHQPINNLPLQPYKNFIPSIHYMMNNCKELSLGQSDIRSSVANVMLNYKQVSNSFRNNQLLHSKTWKYGEILHQRNMPNNKQNTILYNPSAQIGRETNKAKNQQQSQELDGYYSAHVHYTGEKVNLSQVGHAQNMIDSVPPQTRITYNTNILNPQYSLTSSPRISINPASVTSRSAYNIKSNDFIPNFATSHVRPYQTVDSSQRIPQSSQFIAQKPQHYQWKDDQKLETTTIIEKINV